MNKIYSLCSIFFILSIGFVSAVSLDPESLSYSQDPNTFVERNLTIKNDFGYATMVNVAFNFTENFLEVFSGNASFLCFFVNESFVEDNEEGFAESISNNYSFSLEPNDVRNFRFFSVVLPDAPVGVYSCGVNFTYFQQDSVPPSTPPSSSGGGHRIVDEDSDYDERVKVCSPQYSCNGWSGCHSDNYSRRICKDIKECTVLPRIERKTCVNEQLNKEFSEQEHKEEELKSVSSDKPFYKKNPKAMFILFVMLLVGMILWFNYDKWFKGEDGEQEPPTA